MNIKEILEAVSEQLGPSSKGQSVSFTSEELAVFNALDPLIFTKTERLLNIVQDVAKLHKDSLRKEEPWCKSCKDAWPCPTISAIFSGIVFPGPPFQV